MFASLYVPEHIWGALIMPFLTEKVKVVANRVYELVQFLNVSSSTRHSFSSRNYRRLSIGICFILRVGIGLSHVVSLLPGLGTC